MALVSLGAQLKKYLVCPYLTGSRLYVLDKIPEGPEGISKAIAVNMGFVAILYGVFVVLLYIAAPLYFVLWHELVANSQLPIPEKLSKFLLLYLIRSDRSLNAFVKQSGEKVTDAFEKNNDVLSRSVWVPSPF